MYYEVWVRSVRYHGIKPLTYSYGGKISIGTLVYVPLRSERVLGFVSAIVAEPAFAVKPIADVLALPPLPPTCVLFAAWIRHFYLANIGVVATQLLPNKLTPRQLGDVSLTRVPVNPGSVVLTDEQRAAMNRITKPDTYLLHGRTGSGKTQIYIELTRKSITEGKSALILSPEIGLTSQLAAIFRDTFGAHVIVLHSRLTIKERETAWQQILCAAMPVIVIGPRSALFSPIHRLGLIVIDEVHDQAYKQEKTPYYNAVHVAAELRSLHNATLILGSATPNVADYYTATIRQKTILRLNELAISHNMKRSIYIVDLKDKTQFNRSSHISNTLVASITEALERKEQSLLYLNRRGTARLTLCQSCGWQAQCPNCDLPLAYHGDSHSLLCHICGFKQSPTMTCPECGSQSIILKSFGTKAIVDEIHHLFPEARILRLDTDSKAADRLETQYKFIHDGNVDILIGTQMLSKGLDLPRLSTLGIIMADSSLYLPDFTAQERTYQLLTQVLGRIGRGHLQSRAIIQTYQPSSPIIQAALNDDWDSFYTTELVERKKYLFPPFCFLLKITCKNTTSSSAERTLHSFKQSLKKKKLPVIIDGPAPSFHEKVAGKYLWQLVIKSRNRSHLQDIIAMLPNNMTYDIDPANLL